MAAASTETTRQAVRILTPQRGGFLAGRSGAFTHSLSPYIGCRFGLTACGTYCYAQYLPSWRVGRKGEWGESIIVKENAADLLYQELRRMPESQRRAARIFMSTVTDPYQPAESRHRLTRSLLTVFRGYPTLDLLVVQTRSPLAARDLDLMASIPYLWLSVTVETDQWEVCRRLGGGPSPAARLRLVRIAADAGIPVQITVSPCLQHSPGFASTLLDSGAKRIVVDTFVDGDGSQGRRTARSRLADAHPNWRDTTAAHELYRTLVADAPPGIGLGWSEEGFCGVPGRSAEPR